MSNKTYLEIVNNVLRRLREPEVTSVNSTTYSKMIGDFVNDAREMVQNAWHWSGLQQEFTVSTTTGNSLLTLPNSNKTLIEYAYNTSDDFKLEYRPKEWINDRYEIGENPQASPVYWTYNSEDSSNNTVLKLYPEPDAAYVLKFFCSPKDTNLTDDSDVVFVPDMPIIHLTVALAARERGETGGTSVAEYFAIADKFLTDAIALDAAKHPEDTIWYHP